MRPSVDKFLRFGFLIFLVLVLAATTPGFATADNLADILRFSAVLIIMGVGMTFVIISAGIDLSVGSVFAFASITAAWAMQAELPLALSFLVAILAGALWGTLNGTMVVWLRLPPFVATLASMGLARGAAHILAKLISGTTTVHIPSEAFRYLYRGNLLGFFPMPVLVMLAVVALGHYVLHHTRLGRYTFAIGSNVQAARYSGIAVRRYTLMVYVLLGGLAGLASLIETAQNGNGQAVFGQGYELLVIAAVVIGGGSLSGGQGTVVGTLTGALIMGVIDNGCTLNGLRYEHQLVVISILIVVAVTFDTYRRRRAGI
ncbi:MAG: ABC transporter permease [Candidatus Brocadiia bacterium]